MMRQITKACFTDTSMMLDDSNVSNNNANVAAESDKLISPVLTMPELTTPELTSHDARINDRGMAGDHVASAGKSLSETNVTGDATEAMETKGETLSADLSSVGYVISLAYILNNSILNAVIGVTYFEQLNLTFLAGECVNTEQLYCLLCTH